MEEEILEKLLKKGIGFEKLSHPAVFTSEEAHLLSLPPIGKLKPRIFS